MNRLAWSACRVLVLLPLGIGGASAQSIMHGPAAADAHGQIDQLFAQLKAAESEADAGQIETEIARVWTQSVSPAVLLLLARGVREQQAGDGQAAEEDFDAVVTLDPGGAEGYYRRAMTRQSLGETAGALADLQATLAREQRYFPALRSLSEIAEAQGDYKSALAAWQKLLEIDPRTADAQVRLDLLTRRALGQGI